MPTMVELFCGTKSGAKAAAALGYDTWTTDMERRFNPDLAENILNIELEDIPEPFRHPDVVWASPPCQKFSVTQIGRNWRVTEDGQHLPRNKETEIAMVVLAKTLMLIKEMRPTYFIIENPRDKMRSLPMMLPYYLSDFFGEVVVRRTANHCQYWEPEKKIKPQKPTDYWTNNLRWQPRPECSPGDPCHAPAPRGSNKGVQGMSDSKERAIVPHELCLEFMQACLPGEIDRKPATAKAWVF